MKSPSFESEAPLSEATLSPFRLSYAPVITIVVVVVVVIIIIIITIIVVLIIMPINGH
jgi:hypothetical protein